jgi:ATP-dependent Clp protease protease subunit
MNMRVIPVVEDDRSKSDICSRLLKDRIILVTGEVNEEMAELVVAQLLYLDSDNSDKDIKMYINSPGGVITDGMAIFDTMRLVKSDVSTICIGQACSMGSFLLAGGVKGKRFITRNAEVMIHQPSGGTSGQCTNMEISVKHILKTKNRLEKYLSEFTGKPLETIHTDCDRDFWMDADEAVEYGIVDSVIE